jgi:nitrous oxidase accessory protein NosD
MDKRATASFTLILLCLVASSAVCLQPIKAQLTQTFYHITPDGGINPPTTLIQQTSNSLYILTDDMDNSVIIVQRSDIILDGDGHSLNTGIIEIISVKNVTARNLTISNWGSILITVDDASDVTIENTTMTGGVSPFQMIGAISIDNSNSTKIIGNNIKNEMLGVMLSKSNQTQIIRNNIIDISNSWGYYSAGVILRDSSNNSIYYNNFINNDHGAQVDSNLANSWDNGRVGNYWSDYPLKYPNATEIGDSGVGNTPYVINASNTDRYPLIKQVDTSSTEPIPTPTPLSSSIGAWISPLIITVVTVTVIVVVAFSLLLYRRHHKA